MRYYMTKNSVFYLQREAWDDIKEYKDNYKKVIKEREESRLPFHHESPQFSYRPHLVDYLKKICIEKKLSHCCLHLAVYILDIFMDNHSIIPEKILLVTNVCLLLAAKFEENSMTIPKIAELNRAINNRYQIIDYKALEIVMLKFFSWYIMYPTTAHYVYYYIQTAITEEDVRDKGIGMRSVFYNLHTFVGEYLDQIIENIHYMQCYPPSKLAAGIIAVSRLDIGLSCWTEQLENITDYKREEIETQIFVLRTKYPFINCPKCKIPN
ncbi:cyclin-J isoform X2 [Diorhabda carinulata]|uniref:cyclin-J isoform X1 n=1 Tax=Diorhabda sublineata TaxID=1163346 RepID=UPI0024E0E027|nr:cyclin-J isoform X1 [Diorhabda sublineata]XP_057669799.1 cyclin-J isoform X2 [Diorhabda carinulata]